MIGLKYPEEKEINDTKLNSFYTTRTLYINKRNVSYGDSRINKFHVIVWCLLFINSNQLKGIASDKYLAFKYVEMKMGKNLSSYKIGVLYILEEANL